MDSKVLTITSLIVAGILWQTGTTANNDVMKANRSGRYYAAFHPFTKPTTFVHQVPVPVAVNSSISPSFFPTNTNNTNITNNYYGTEGLISQASCQVSMSMFKDCIVKEVGSYVAKHPKQMTDLTFYHTFVHEMLAGCGV